MIDFFWQPHPPTQKPTLRERWAALSDHERDQVAVRIYLGLVCFAALCVVSVWFWNPGVR